MSDFVHAPFSPEEVERLNEHQSFGERDTVRCPNPEATAHSSQLLIATPQGWVCAECGYSQDWAPAWMVQPLAHRERQAAEELRDRIHLEGWDEYR